MTQNPKVILHAGVVILLVGGASLIGITISLLHQGESEHPFGMLVFWTAYVAIAACLAATFISFRNAKLAKSLVLFAIVFTIPLTIVTAMPIVWCSFLECSTSTWQFTSVQWGGLILVLPALLSLLGLIWLSKV